MTRQIQCRVRPKASGQVLAANRLKFPGINHEPRSLWFATADPFGAFLDWLRVRQVIDCGRGALDLTDAQRFDVWCESWARAIRKEYDNRPDNGGGGHPRNCERRVHEIERIDLWRRNEVRYWVSVCDLTERQPPDWLDHMQLEEERA